MLAVGEEWVVMEDGVYEVDYQRQSWCLRAEGEVLLGAVVGGRAWYLAGGEVRWCGEGGERGVARAGCESDYCWGVGQGLLMCANL